MTYYTRMGQSLAPARKKLNEHTDTLYVCRPLLNTSDIIEWAKGEGFATTYLPEDMHVTICYSKQPVDWGMMTYQMFNLAIPPEIYGGRGLIVLGGDTAVLTFASWPLEERHRYFQSMGASWDYDSYTAHLSISRDVPPNLDQMKPYYGPILLGPEKFSKVESGWADGIVEKHDGPR